MPTTLERLARNQILFREVNERLLELSEGAYADEFDFVCECSGTECAETVTLSLVEYDRIRARATAFVIAPGHETLEVETVVESNERYAVVEKTHEQQFALETDPRGDFPRQT